jgi:hypothetical protein
MATRPSLTRRIIIGKSLGFAFGLAGFLLLPLFDPQAGWLLRWGILFWYTTLGAIIALFGVMTRSPVIEIPLPWMFRGIFLGAWMNFMLTFFAYDAMQAVMVWFTLEGAIIGLIIDYAATRWGGDGPEAAER